LTETDIADDCLDTVFEFIVPNDNRAAAVMATREE
jgi:hypothetical protein